MGGFAARPFSLLSTGYRTILLSGGNRSHNAIVECWRCVRIRLHRRRISRLFFAGNHRVEPEPPQLRRHLRTESITRLERSGLDSGIRLGLHSGKPAGAANSYHPTGDGAGDRKASLPFHVQKLSDRQYGRRTVLLDVRSFAAGCALIPRRPDRDRAPLRPRARGELLRMAVTGVEVSHHR